MQKGASGFAVPGSPNFLWQLILHWILGGYTAIIIFVQMGKESHLYDWVAFVGSC